MAVIPGSVLVTGFVAPSDSTDVYPSHDAKYGKDGYRSVADHTERDNISTDRRRWGMVVFTQNDEKRWQLGSDLTTWTDISGTSVPITLNYIPKGTGTTIADGTWAFSGNNILPNTTGANIGQSANRVGTAFINTMNYATDLVFSENGSEKGRFLTGGNFGVGTNNPVAKAHFFSTTEQLRLSYDNSNYISNTVSSSGLYTLNTVGSGASYLFNVGGTSTLRIDNNGSVYNLGAANLSFNTAFGNNSLISITTGNYNASFGFDALRRNTTGNWNAAFGYQALAFNTTGTQNTATGYQAMYTNTSGQFNTATGESALYSNTIGSSNDAHGYVSLYSNTEGISNVAMGQGSLQLNTTGSNNVAIGFQALNKNVGGSTNTAIGHTAMGNSVSGQQNVAVGYRALLQSTTSSYNTAIGVNSLFSTNGNENTAVGYDAMRSNQTGAYNCALGLESLYNNVDGVNNSAVGYQAGKANVSGNASVFLGYQAGQYETASNSFYVHNGLGVSNLATGKSNSLMYGIFNAAYTSQYLFINGVACVGTFTSTERDALTPVNGMILYNSTTSKLQARASGSWVDLH